MPNDIQSSWIGRTRDDWDDYWNSAEDNEEYDDDYDYDEEES